MYSAIWAIAAPSASRLRYRDVPTMDLGALAVPTIDAVPTMDLGAAAVPTMDLGALAVPTIDAVPTMDLGAAAVPTIDAVPTMDLGALAVPTMDLGAAAVPTIEAVETLLASNIPPVAGRIPTASITCPGSTFSNFTSAIAGVRSMPSSSILALPNDCWTESTLAL